MQQYKDIGMYNSILPFQPIELQCPSVQRKHTPQHVFCFFGVLNFNPAWKQPFRPPPKLVFAPAFVRSIVLCKIQPIARCWPQLAKFGLLPCARLFVLRSSFGCIEPDVFCKTGCAALSIHHLRNWVNFRV